MRIPSVWVLGALSWHVAAEVVLPLVRTADTGPDLLQNGGFEQAVEQRPSSWQPAPQGFEWVGDAGRARSAALRCVNADGRGWAGASQTIALNRTQAVPLRVRGWSRAEAVAGAADSGYALYVDLRYADGTPLWGQTGNFRCGTHDWEQQEFVILPEKPVQSLTVHVLLRGHAGTVWFDDVAVHEAAAPAGSVLFQGVAVTAPTPAVGRAGEPERITATPDGLRLGWSGTALVSVGSDGRSLGAGGPGGFLVRDAATNSDFHGFVGGACPELGLKLETECVVAPTHLTIEGRITDLTGTDRAVTVVFAVPLEARGWTWGDDIRRSRVIAGSGEYAETVGVRCGATGTMSSYPVAAVSNAETGLALALDLAQPAVYRLGYHAGTRQLFIAYDFGLVRDTARFPGAAPFRFVIYRFDAASGFRAAFQKFMRIFPDHFVVRSREQGIWMPFTDVSKVEGWQDFGFRYHEGNNNVPWDDAHGVLSFRYTEPMTWWMPMGKDVPRTPAEAAKVREELARTGRESEQRMAAVSGIAAMFDESGQPALLFRDEPWCNGAVWSLNPNPDLGKGGGAPLNAATVHWNERLKARLYGPEAVGRLDGEYLDSLEGYVTAELNFRREHFRASTVPLTFDVASKQPALFKGLAVFEFTRWIADEVHRLDKLMFANGVPYRFSFLCPWLDVMGTETDWVREGRYSPASHRQMALWRTLSGAKPYVLLMNTDYDAFGPEMVERYFARCLFYGMFPGFFSHNAAENPYWQNPRWYNRDRPLFKKYLPTIKRVAEAGWQPVTGAHSTNPGLWIERFGPTADGTTHFTVHNETAAPQRGVVTVGGGDFEPDWGQPVRDGLSDRPLEGGAAGVPVEVAPQQTAVITVKSRPVGPVTKP